MTAAADQPGDEPRPLEHYRAGEEAPVDPGVYRVVGRDPEAVTLLRVAEDGRRAHTGAVVRLHREALDALAPAENPDTGWSRLRQAPSTLADRPLYAGLGLLLVASGAYDLAVVGDRGGLVLLGGGLAVLWMLVR